MAKPLDPEKVKELLKIQRNKEISSETIQEKIAKWPGTENLKRLAKAVGGRAPKVVFVNGDTFTIRYESNFASVFIKPADGNFVPCGYFSYEALKNALIDEVTEAE